MVERQRIADVVTVVGWCLLAGFVATIVYYGDQARAFGRGRGFAQQASVVAYAVVPANAALVALAAGAALAAQVVRSSYVAPRAASSSTSLAWATIGAGGLGAMLTVLGAWSALTGEEFGNGFVRALLYLGSGAVIIAAALLATLAIRISPAPTNHAPTGVHHARPSSPFTQPPGHRRADAQLPSSPERK